MTNEAATRTEEEVSIVIIQMGESIEHETVYRHINGSGEQGSFVETDPVNVMIIRHGLLTILHPSIDTLLYTCGTVTEVLLSDTLATSQPLEMRE
jgi:hypothetical protein